MLLNTTKRPSERQRKHCAVPVYGILHFGLNTFVNKEWGYGDTPREVFNPVEFDPRQVAEACKNGGLGGVIIVCKHHDGFCLWPTKTTDYSVAHTVWNRDFVGELSTALRQAGLKVGFYISPWDRHQPTYGTPAYLAVFKEQLREVLTAYGEAFEVWFDGANGGDGYYGGAREKRSIDLGSYYDWENIWGLVRALQPNAAIFSDVGPDLRWVGNERGFAAMDSRAGFTPVSKNGKARPGCLDCTNSPQGDVDGMYYLPPECDLPLRPGWFYHETENDRLKSVPELIEIYEHSVGQGGFMNLGIVLDDKGVMPGEDARRLAEFNAACKGLYRNTLFADDESAVSDRECVIDFETETAFNFIELKEPLEYGEQVTAYSIEVKNNTEWRRIHAGKSIGINRICRFAEVTGNAVRIRVESSTGKVDRLSVKICNADTPRSTDSRNLPGNYRALPQAKISGMELNAVLPETMRVCGVVFTPETGDTAGLPLNGRLFVLANGEWGMIAEAEFSNIIANPIPQTIAFPDVDVTAIKLVAGALASGDCIRFKEIGVLV